jgi:hypothetical protein
VAPVEVQDSFFVEGGYDGGAGINGNAAQSRQISGRNGEAWIFGIACANARSGFEKIGGRGQHTFLLARHADWELLSLRIPVPLLTLRPDGRTTSLSVGRKCQPFPSRHDGSDMADLHGSSARDQAGKSTHRACGFYCTNLNNMPFCAGRSAASDSEASAFGSHHFIEPFG